MPKTTDLLQRAIDAHPEFSVRKLSAHIGMSESAISVAKTRQKVSPTLAAALARLMHEDEMYWTALAGLESDKPSRARDEMLRAAAKWQPELQTAPEGAVQIGGEGGFWTLPRQKDMHTGARSLRAFFRPSQRTFHA